MLAAAAAGLDARLQPGRHGLAPPAEFRARLLEAAGRVWPRRGDAGAQVAREIQRLGPHPLGRPHLRERAHPRARLAPGAHLPRCLGRRGVSVPLPARAEPPRLAVADARVASDDCDPGRAGSVEHPLEPAEARRPVVAGRHAAAHRSRLSERVPRFIPPSPRRGRADAAAVDGGAPSAPAARPPARAARRGPHALAPTWRAATGTALARDDVGLERALAGSGGAAQIDRSHPPGAGRLRPARQRARPLGPGDAGRVFRGRPAAHDGGRARQRASARPAPLVARRPAARTRPRARLLVGRPRSGVRPCLAGRRGSRPRRPAPRPAHTPAVHGLHGNDHRGPETTAGRRRVMGDVSLYRRLLLQARPYWLHLAGAFALGLLASPLALLNPVPLKIVVDSVLGGHPLPAFLRPLLPEAAARSPAAILFFAIGLLVVVAVLGQLQGLATTLLRNYVGERLVLDFRSRLVEQALRLSMSYHDSRGTADSLYRIHHDAPAIQSIMVDGVLSLVSAAVTLAMMIAVTARLDGQLALVALAVSPPLFLLSRAYRPRMRRQSRHVKNLESSALAIAQETLGALRVVKAFGQEARATDRFL